MPSTWILQAMRVKAAPPKLQGDGHRCRCDGGPHDEVIGCEVRCCEAGRDRMAAFAMAVLDAVRRGARCSVRTDGRLNHFAFDRRPASRKARRFFCTSSWVRGTCALLDGAPEVRPAKLWPAGKCLSGQTARPKRSPKLAESEGFVCHCKPTQCPSHLEEGCGEI